MKRVLVLGGSGMLGQALLRELARCDVQACFTYHRNEQQARALSDELGYRAYTSDLRMDDAVEVLFEQLAESGTLPDAVVHCAGVAQLRTIDAVTPSDWRDVHAIHGMAAMQCAQQMARRGLTGALVLVSALDGVEAVPAPAHYAASQGAMWGLTMALAKELGPKGILVNLALLGVLDGGIASHLEPRLRDSYRRYAALGRTGTCIEAARALRWLAIENSYLNGARFPVTGGLG